MSWQLISFCEYRILAEGWWADVEMRWGADKVWRVAVLNTNAYGRVALADIAITAARELDVPPEQMAWADTGGPVCLPGVKP